jgi:hypothetical protein
MRTDELLEHCEREVENSIKRYADMLFGQEQNALLACLRDHPDPIGGCMQLLALATRAVQARAWFGRHAPCWCQPLPLLSHDEQENILCGGDIPRHLVVYYAYSLQRRGFDYLGHPLFYDYARGVLASKDCPNYMQHDEELLAEFPPKRLPGLVDGIYWRPLWGRSCGAVNLAA